jgi:hypothetical protein
MSIPITIGDPISVLTDGLWKEYSATATTVYVSKDTKYTLDEMIERLVPGDSDRRALIKSIIDGGAPVTNYDTPSISVGSDPSKKLANMGARAFIIETCWLAPQIYSQEVGEELVVVPAYRDEFIETYLGPATMPGEQFRKGISLSLYRRQPASVRESNMPFDRGKEVLPRVREESKNEGPGYTTVLGQKFDNIIKFDCWAKSNMEADALIDWLEVFLVKWQFWYEGLGIDKMFYYSSGAEVVPGEAAAMVNWKQPFKLRTLEWYVRDEKLFYLDQSEIEQIRLRILTEGSSRRLEYLI